MKFCKRWGAGELETLCKHYPRLGGAGMMRAGYLADRPLGSITKRANMLGLVCLVKAQADAQPEVAVPVPRMEPYEARACVEFNNAFAALNGLVNREQPMRIAL